MDSVTEIKEIWKAQKEVIDSRLKEFKKLWEEGSEDEIFAELAFCLLTPQSKATICWRAVENLRDSGVLWFGNAESITDYLKGVRFKYTKAQNIVRARNFFTINGKLKIRETLSQFSDPRDMRDFLVRNVRGMGYKEASHFLRNVGLGEDLAILDRHILKNLLRLGVIDEIPKGLTKRRYLEIEERMRMFSKTIGIPMAHLDLVLWYRQTGMVFK